ncbi:MAG TPA: tyrosine--tRNA ligase [Geminicoccus sp.]|uniref:tyrosine--tRNA ligase n=1 Tax=Geminicoccus sp. TaxID=2024832 RepID=UPI002E35F2FA|nr:tyrosine--tRNA ligase [Geminicoccus sp.]HEX2525878.1 tyrosine--tRNA ligase [Geminicoccus sp.]
MTGHRSELLRELHARGFVHQCTDESAFDEATASAAITGYIGFDCTAPSLHVGNLVSIMLLRTLQRFGHRPVALVGGGTTLVGDPSGKDELRKIQTAESLEANKAGIRASLARFLDFGPGKTTMVDNAEWLLKLNYLEFLRDYGRHFTINRMLTFDSVRLRLEREQPLTFLEFNYMLLQAYDFLELSRRHGVRLQMGGSDQWGNIVNGVELGRRVDNVQLFGLTTPLITTASGEKMGKSAGNAVWLNDSMLPPFDYWQFWRNTEDRDVGRFLRLYTELPLDEVARLERLEGVELNEAKAVLATEATALCHGREAAEKARLQAQGVFGGGDRDALPVVDVVLDDGVEHVALPELFRLAGLAASNGEARRLIQGGGAKVEDQALSDPQQTVGRAQLVDGLKLSAGKKRHVLVRTRG